MDWLIAHNPEDVEVLQDARKKLIDEYVDLDTLKSMSFEDSRHWGIKWGLCKRLMRDIKQYIKEVDSGHE